MRHVISGGLVAAALGAALVVASAFPVSAQIARPQSALEIDGSNGDLLTLVQDRRSGGGAVRSGGGRSGGGAALRAGGGGREGARVSRASRGDSVRVSRASRDTRVARSGGREVRRFNNNNRRWTNWRWRNNRYGYRYGYPYGYGYYGYGSGLAVGLALSAPYYAYGRGYYVGDDAVAYCMSRFRSYDPVSGTYLGFDGLRHPCP